MTEVEAVKHIRPKKRAPPRTSFANDSNRNNPVVPAVNGNQNTASSSKMMDSILREPKYSTKKTTITTFSTKSKAAPAIVNVAPSRGEAVTRVGPNTLQQPSPTVVAMTTSARPADSSRQNRRVVQDFVVERPRRKADPTPSRLLQGGANATRTSALVGAIEGYLPVTTTLQIQKAAAKETRAARGRPMKESEEEHVDDEHDDNDKDENDKDDNQADDDDDDKKEDDLVFSSLASLMQAAGTLEESAKTNRTVPPTMVEAELNFACVDPDEYQELKTEEQQLQYAVAMGTSLQDDDGEDTDSEADAAAGGLWGLLGDDDDEDQNEQDVTPAIRPRAFLHLWTALAQWVTPVAVAWIRNLPTRDPNTWVETFDRSDVGASRCAGLMAILQMHTTRCWGEVSGNMEGLRTVERRLADLLRSFDYSLPTPRLETSQARALTCVFLDIARGNTDASAVPDCCAALGMTLDEYRYLTRSALVNFEPASSD